MGDSISVVIPVYNAENSLAELHHRLSKTLQKITEDYEIIMVDDFSVDDSYTQILQLHKKDKKVKAIKLARNFGQQNALICGFNYIKGDYVVTIDDDLQHNPEDIINLYNTIRKGYQVVYCIPVNREYRIYRKIGSKLTNILFSLITPKKRGIRVSSFRIMTRELVEKIIKNEDSFVYISALILQYTDNIANIYVSHIDRKYGKSNYNFMNLARLFIKLYIYHGNLSLLKLFRSKEPQYIIKEKKSFCSTEGD